MSPQRVDLKHYSSGFSLSNKLGRLAWQIVQATLFRMSPTPLFAWRNLLLRAFGAKIAPGAHVYPSVKIWAPWNLSMGAQSCLASEVDCYCVAKIRLGENATVSQYSFLCSATHDYEDPAHTLLAGPIEIGDGAWLAADVFVAPSVKIGEGAVIGARSSVFKDVKPWMLALGNPARVVKERKLRARAKEL